MATLSIRLDKTSIEESLDYIDNNATCPRDWLSAKARLIIGVDSDKVYSKQLDFLTSIDIKRDYISACGDEIIVAAQIGLGDLSYEILPNKNNLMMDLTMTNLDGNGNIYYFTRRYICSLITGSDDASEPEMANVEKEKLNQSKVITVSFLLLPVEFSLLEILEINEDFNVKDETSLVSMYPHVVNSHFSTTAKITYQGKVLGSKDFPINYDVVSLEDVFFEITRNLKVYGKAVGVTDKYEEVFLEELFKPFKAKRMIVKHNDLIDEKIELTPLKLTKADGKLSNGKRFYPFKAGIYLQYRFNNMKRYTEVDYINESNASKRHKITPTIHLYPIYTLMDPILPIVDYNSKHGDDITKKKTYISCYIPNDLTTYSLSDKTYFLKDTGELCIIAGTDTTMIDKRSTECKSLITATLSGDDVNNIMKERVVNVDGKKGEPGKETATISGGNVMDGIKSGLNWALDLFSGLVGITRDPNEEYEHNVDKGEDSIKAMEKRELVDKQGDLLIKFRENAFSRIRHAKQGNQDYEEESFLKQTILFDIDWKWSNPDLIYPSMPIQIFKYNKKKNANDVYKGRVVRTMTSYDLGRKSIATRIQCMVIDHNPVKSGGK